MEQQPRPMYLLVFLVFLFVTFTVYGNTFLNEWTYDDVPVIVENTDVHSLRGFIEDSRPGRPLRELTYVIDYRLFGDKPAGYRIQQLAWHAANGYLIFLVLVLVGLKPLHALIGGTFFLVHPLQVESVANISHRKELLALFFSLSSLLAYSRAALASGGKRLGFLVLAVLCFATALLANQTAVTFPVVVILFEYLFLGKERRILLAFPRLLAIVSLAVGSCFLYLNRGLFTIEQVWNVYSKNNFGASESYYPLFMGVMRSFGFYLGKIAAPVNLAPEYAITFSEALFQPLGVLGMVLLAGLLLATVALMRSRAVAAFGIGCFLILYLPVSNLVPAGYMVADRYMYMPLAGVAIVIAWGAARIPNARALAACCGLLAVLALLSVVQNGHWRDEHTLWRHAARVNPDSTWARESAAYSYYLKGDYGTARLHARKALEINRYNTKAYLVLARIEEARGDIREAARNYEMFQSVGEVEYPDLVKEVRLHLPVLQERIRILEGARSETR